MNSTRDGNGPEMGNVDLIGQPCLILWWNDIKSEAKQGQVVLANYFKVEKSINVRQLLCL